MTQKSRKLTFSWVTVHISKSVTHSLFTVISTTMMCTHKYTDTNTCILHYTDIWTHTHTYTKTHAHTYTHPHSHTHTCMHAPTPTHMHKSTHTHIRTQPYTFAYAHTHCTYTRTCTTHTQACTHTHLFQGSPLIHDKGTICGTSSLHHCQTCDRPQTEDMGKHSLGT